jgi:hypothetical protein
MARNTLGRLGRTCIGTHAWGAAPAPGAARPQYPELVAFHHFVSGLDGIKEYLGSPRRMARINGNDLG